MPTAGSVLLPILLAAQPSTLAAQLLVLSVKPVLNLIRFYRPFSERTHRPSN